MHSTECRSSYNGSGACCAVCSCSNVLRRWREFTTRLPDARRNWVEKTGLTALCWSPSSCCDAATLPPRSHFCIVVVNVLITLEIAPCGLRCWKNRPAPFRGRMSYKATKPSLIGLSYLSMFFIVLLLISAPFLYIVSFRWYVFHLLVVLVKLLVLANLARKTPLKKLNRSEGSSP